MDGTTRDDFGGEAVLHIEIDEEPVDFGHPNTPAHGNVGVSPTTETVSFEVGNSTVTIDVTAFIDDVRVGGV
jgi:hypothetical protein